MAVTDDRLKDTVQALIAPGKGILAVDETPGTLTSRFQALSIVSTPESRRDYRELLFRTEGIERHISGAILNDETLRQQAVDGTPMGEVLSRRGILPGVKVDRGIFPLAGAPGEGITEGLDGLRPRLEEYFRMGARFAKWRALFTIGLGLPSQTCIDANAHALARYAALCQEAGVAPIVEVELLLDGQYEIQTCADATEATLRAVFREMVGQRAQLEGLLLKVNMVQSGKDTQQRAEPEEVAVFTVASLKRTVPAAVPGIVFLSGGQSDDESVRNLNAIATQAAASGAPWQLSFSFARALQGAPMRAWAGKAENVPLAQEVFQHRAQVTSTARRGEYAPERELLGAGGT